MDVFFFFLLLLPWKLDALFFEFLWSLYVLNLTWNVTFFIMLIFRFLSLNYLWTHWLNMFLPFINHFIVLFYRGTINSLLLNIKGSFFWSVICLLLLLYRFLINELIMHVRYLAFFVETHLFLIRERLTVLKRTEFPIHFILLSIGILLFMLTVNFIIRYVLYFDTLRWFRMSYWVQILFHDRHHYLEEGIERRLTLDLFEFGRFH